MELETSEEYPPGYFEHRLLNDPRRMKSFEHELEWMGEFVNTFLSICDVGCSTGEFLQFINWRGPRFGVEPVEFAATQARGFGIDIVDSVQDLTDLVDVFVLRGVIQHLPDPFRDIRAMYSKLRKGGYLIFLATPDAGSPYYRIFQDLPAVDLERNYWLPSHKQLVSICRRAGFTHVASEWPYRKSGYSQRSDLLKFLARAITREKRFQGAFPGNMMNVAFRRP